MYFQNKFYPKDSAKDALCKGRVRVQLKQSDASFVNEKFQSSKLIYKLSWVFTTWQFLMLWFCITIG